MNSNNVRISYSYKTVSVEEHKKRMSDVWHIADALLLRLASTLRPKSCCTCVMWLNRELVEPDSKLLDILESRELEEATIRNNKQ